jgi:hypothetical protein
MEEGYVVDYGHGGYRRVASWVAGPPVKSYWLGLKIAGAQTPVRTFRCTACGYLESYAPSGTRSKNVVR